jgi:hypothetical protein
MTRPSALKVVLPVLVMLIAALPAGAGAKTIRSSFGNWTATFSGTFDYKWSEPDPEPCHTNGDGSVRARFSGSLGEFEISYVRAGAFSAFGLLNNTTRVSGSVTETDNRMFNPGPDRYGYPCEPRTIDKSGCGTHGYHNATFDLDSTTSDRRLFGPFILHMTMDLGGTLNAFASNPCYTGEGALEDFGYFAGNSPNDSDTGAANWEYRLGKLVGPRLHAGMFEHRRAFMVTAHDTHRSTFAGPASYTGQRSVTVTFTPVEHKLRVEELGPPSITVLDPARFRARTFPPWATATSYKWQMRRANSSQWTTLGTTATKTFPWTFRLAGHFKWRVIIYGLTAPGFGTEPVHVGRTETLQVRFPTRDQISNHQAVQSIAQDAWALTLHLANPQTRREVGFWITLNTCSGRYGHTMPPRLGPEVGPRDDATVNLGSQPADIPRNPTLADRCATYPVATFHTHTPTTYRVPIGESRPVGPSRVDRENASGRGLPGFVFDYAANPPGSMRIPFGYRKDEAAFVYRYGPVRRPTPR